MNQRPTYDDESIEAQRQRYNQEANEHFQHKQDDWTQLYRTTFVRKFLGKIDLENKAVLDAMCASGIETGYLLDRGATVVGLDISENNASLYEKKWQRKCTAGSIHNTGFEDGTFDVVYVYGGLHHIIPLLDQAIKEIHRILKPGGMFVFVEPNKDTWLNLVRMVWYKLSSRFEDDESALSYQGDLAKYREYGFSEQSVDYGGNVAYLLIAQSSVLKIPHAIKEKISKLLFAIERAITWIPGVPKLFFVGIWKKLPN